MVWSPSHSATSNFSGHLAAVSKTASSSSYLILNHMEQIHCLEEKKKKKSDHFSDSATCGDI